MQRIYFTFCIVWLSVASIVAIVIDDAYGDTVPTTYCNFGDR